MRILLLTTHLNLGGIGIYVLSLAKGLVQRGHQVFVASSGGDLVRHLQSFGAEHLAVNIKTKSELSFKLIQAYRQIMQVVQKKDIEIVHAHTRVAQLLAHLVCKRRSLVYVTTCHGFFKPRLFRRMFPCWGSYCIAISEAVREHLVNDLGVSKQSVSVVHNGVEMERFFPDKFGPAEREKIKKDYGLHSNLYTIGTIARLSRVKGQHYLILAMKRLLQANQKVQLLLVGDGPEKERLRNLVDQLGIANKVFFAPSTFDTSAALSALDLFVFPSLMEGLGLAIIEAQAMGLPVVATDVGGIYSLVKDGVNGFLVRPKDAQSLADAILRLLRDNQMAKEFGRKAKVQVRDYFNLQQMVSGIEQVYKKGLGHEG